MHLTNIERQRELEIKKGEEQLLRIRTHVVLSATNLLGAPSRQYLGPDLGMDPRDGYDCSGFIVSLLQDSVARAGVDLRVPRHANEQWREFGEAISYGQRKSGDLVYFPSRKKSGLWVVGHVGLLVAKNEYIHAPGRDDTVVESVELNDEQAPLEDVCENDLYTHTPVGVKRITLPLEDGRWHIY